MAKKDRRVQIAPKFQLGYETSLAFKGLPATSKDKVWRKFHSWITDARKRNAEYWNLQPDTSSLNEDEREVLTVMIQNVCSGLDSFWSRAVRDDTVSDSLRQSQAVSDSLRQSQSDNKEIIKEYNNKRIERESSAVAVPTVDEIRSYASENGLKDDAEKFVAYYSANGWRHRGEAMTNWKAAYQLWLMRGEQYENRPLKKLAAQDYEQREYNEEEMQAILGVHDLFKEEDTENG